ncbi:MAG: hypothetical protein ACOZF0_15530, partial [Thermodesulfobacteriota bacterium]
MADKYPSIQISPIIELEIGRIYGFFEFSNRASQMGERGGIQFRPAEGIDVDAINRRWQPIFYGVDKEKNEF